MKGSRWARDGPDAWLRFRCLSHTAPLVLPVLPDPGPLSRTEDEPNAPSDESIRHGSRCAGQRRRVRGDDCSRWPYSAGAPARGSWEAFLFGYSVSVEGAFIGAMWAYAYGFLLGAAFAFATTSP